MKGVHVIVPNTWTTRPEIPQDVAAIREVNLGAFPTPLEADLVEGLRKDPAWLPELSIVAEDLGENLVLVLGHPEYYPRFGFTPASAYGIRPAFEVPDEAMMALVFDPALPVPSGTIRYPAPFGV